MTVDEYVARSDLWPDEITALRPILREGGLDEQIKWRSPCYSHAGKNIVIMQEMKPHLSLMFFKGALLEDPEGVLKEQGPNSRAARRMEFTSVADIATMAETIAAYVREAIDVEEAGIELPDAPELVLVGELRARLDADAELKAAFESLTPGRQRAYNLHVSDAKQSATRESRVDKIVPRILDGKGLRDR